MDTVTPRERDVLGLMAEGKSNQGIVEAQVVRVLAGLAYLRDSA